MSRGCREQDVHVLSFELGLIIRGYGKWDLPRVEKSPGSG